MKNFILRWMNGCNNEEEGGEGEEREEEEGGEGGEGC